MTGKRFVRAALAAAILAIMMASITHTASSPSGPSITVYRSPT